VNNRELAALIWFGVLVAWALSRRDVRSAFGDVASAAVQPKLAGSFVAMVAYVCGLIYAASLVGVWRSALVSDTVAWYVATGFLLYGASVSLFTGQRSFKRLLLAALGLTAFVEVFVNLYVFPLVIELILVPVLVFLVAMSVVAETKDEFAPVKKLVDGLLTTIGLGVLLYVAIRLAADWENLDQRLGLQKLALPIWLTLGTLPFVAALGIWSHYDMAFSRIAWATNDRRARVRARVALMVGLHLRARDVADFDGLWCKELAATSSSAEARAVVRRFRDRASSPLLV
jgi:hypothetical protein